MKPDPASLENLRDIAVPPPVPWWPPAPGWWVLGLLALLVLIYLGLRTTVNSREVRTLATMAIKTRIGMLVLLILFVWFVVFVADQSFGD